MERNYEIHTTFKPGTPGFAGHRTYVRDLNDAVRVARDERRQPTVLTVKVVYDGRTLLTL